jgi:hypothetical protein
MGYTREDLIDLRGVVPCVRDGSWARTSAYQTGVVSEKLVCRGDRDTVSNILQPEKFVATNYRKFAS